MRGRRFWCHSEVVGPFAVAGYDVLAPLDDAGRRWRAICLADGRPVVLRRWIGAGDRLAEARRQAALWSSVGGAAVVAVRDVLCAGADLVVVSEAGGDPLDVLLARRGALTAGQVVTLVVGLATSLANAHSRGLAHGRVGTSSVVVDADGRPLLTDFVFGGDVDPSADVVALIAMAQNFMDGATPPALVRALESTLDARDLAEQVLAALPAEPLLSSRPWVSPTPVVPRRPTNTGLRAALVVTAAVAVLATLIGVWWGRQEPAAGAPLPRTTPSPAATSPTQSLEVVVIGLERQRVRALAHADVEALDVVEVRNTALWRRDTRTVTQLLAAHLHLRGLRVDVRRVTVLSTRARRAVVRVVDALSSYDVVDARGAIVDHRRSRRARTVDLVLVQENGTWKIRSVSR